MNGPNARPADSAGRAPAWLAIVNPQAGYRRPPRWKEALARRLARELGAEVVFTEHPGHARALATQARDFDGLAVFGGDGTAADVVNGMAVDRQILLLLAGGTGNGLARDLGLQSLEAAFSAARVGRLRHLDLIRVSFQSQGKAESHLAISTASIGYAAEVVALANRFFKPLGVWCYPLAATLQAIECEKVLGGDFGSAGKQVLINAATYQQFVTRFRRNPNCRFSHETWSISPLPASPAKLAVAAVLQPAGRGEASLGFAGMSLARQLACPGCGFTKHVFRLEARLRELAKGTPPAAALSPVQPSSPSSPPQGAPRPSGQPAQQAPSAQPVPAQPASAQAATPKPPQPALQAMDAGAP